MKSDRGSGRRTHPVMTHLECSQLMSALNALPHLAIDDYRFLVECKANLGLWRELDRFPKQIQERQQKLLQLKAKYEITAII